MIKPWLEKFADPHQQKAAELISDMESAVLKPALSQAYGKFLKSLSQALTTQAAMDKILPQILVRFYYLQKDLLRRKKSANLKVWNQSRKLVESIFEIPISPNDDCIKLIQKIEQSLIEKQFVHFIEVADLKVHEHIGKLTQLEQLEKQSVSKKVKDGVTILISAIKELTDSGKEWMDSDLYKEKIVKQKVMTEYVQLIVSQVLSQITDISIDSNDQLNTILLQLQEIPTVVASCSISEDWVFKKNREAGRLKELQLLFKLGLREIGDAVVLYQTIREFTYQEIERIVEARFEKTQLRDSILRTIEKGL